VHPKVLELALRGVPEDDAAAPVVPTRRRTGLSAAERDLMDFLAGAQAPCKAAAGRTRATAS
jgi:hypothetical protein